MSLETPTINGLRDSIVGQISAAIKQNVPFLPMAFIRVLAKVLAAVFLLLYKYGGFIFLQMFVSTASASPTEINGRIVIPLVEWGRLIGAGDPDAGQRAELVIEITVDNQTGTLPSGTQLTNTANGVTYITIAPTALNAPTVQAVVRARADQTDTGGVGANGNLDPGDPILFVNPVPNVNREAVVVSQQVTGANPESTEVYRQNVIDAFQQRPQGGAYADYRQWGEEVPGIINVYPFTGAPGEVDLYSEATVASSGDPDGIPTAAQLLAVLNSVNFDQAGVATRRNVNAFPNSFAITRKGFDVEVTGISGVANVPQVQADIETSLTAYFLSIEPYITGLSVPPRRDKITRTRISAIVEDIVTAAGGTFTSATFGIAPGGAPIESYQVFGGEKAKLVVLTFA